jgi:hypothetical protein
MCTTMTAGKPIFTEDLTPLADDLLFFTDDTGHETFAGSQGFYGFGGCALLGAGYAHLKSRWMEVRRAINGDPAAPLHASEMPRKSANFAVLAEFFLDRSFARIAATTTKAIELPPLMHPCVPVLGQLRKDMAVVAGMLQCKRVWMIMESSQRADPIIKSCFSQLMPMNNSRALSVQKCLMPKSSNEPGLEVADFIVSAAGSQVRRRLRGQSGHASDFKEVFCRIPIVGCWYREVVGVKVDENGVVVVSGVALTE